MRDRIIVTGASGAMGAAATRYLAGKGYHVVMACRNPEKAETVRRGIMSDIPDAEIGIMQLDLSSLESVRDFVKGLEGERISALLNNAGVISRGYSLTGDGLENTFAVNYFGTVLLTRLLLPLLIPEAHVVNTVSLTCRFVKVSDKSLMPEEKEFSRLGTYAKSKLALLHFSQELARRNPLLKVNVADPGIVNSNMISMGKWFDPLADALFRPFCKSPEKGVRPALSALFSELSGKYFVGQRVIDIPGRFVDQELEKRLWDETSRIIGL